VNSGESSKKQAADDRALSGGAAPRREQQDSFGSWAVALGVMILSMVIGSAFYFLYPLMLSRSDKPIDETARAAAQADVQQSSSVLPAKSPASLRPEPEKKRK
jgi:hypothetical protein